MDQTIDLDGAAEVASSKVAAVTLPDVHIDALTWRDEDQERPQTLLTDRRSVVRPDSLGIQARRPSKEGSLVLFRGGWADLAFVDSDKSVEIVEAVGFDEPLNLESYGLLVERFFGLFE